MFIYKNLLIKEVDKNQWDDYLLLVDFSNILQTWEYGNSKAKFYCRPYRFVVLDFKNEPVAIFQVLLYKILFLPCLARINRGPLIIKKNYMSYENNSNYLTVIEAIENKLRRLKSFLILISPELKANENNKASLIKLGFKQANKVAWSSSKIYLKKEENEIFLKLKSKWRNMLRKAEKSDLHISCESNENIVDLINIYKKLQTKNNFKGLSNDLILKLSSQMSPFYKFMIYKSYKVINGDKQLLGVVVSILHGTTGTYFIGYTNHLGRKYNANYLLNWNALIEAKKFGLKWFDLGGLTSNTPKGIAHFKKGINGEIYNNVASFYKFNFY